MDNITWSFWDPEAQVWRMATSEPFIVRCADGTIITFSTATTLGPGATN